MPPPTLNYEEPVEVEVLDDERTSTPAVFKDLDNVSPYLLLLCVA